jgi:hypothetical protein
MNELIINVCLLAEEDFKQKMTTTKVNGDTKREQNRELECATRPYSRQDSEG